MTVETGRSIQVCVRYFAAARAAASVDSEQLTLPAGAGVDDLVEHLGARSAELARVLRRCSFLADGVAVRDRAHPVPSGGTIDVLPPFAGG